MFRMYVRSAGYGNRVESLELFGLRCETVVQGKVCTLPPLQELIARVQEESEVHASQ